MKFFFRLFAVVFLFFAAGITDTVFAQENNEDAAFPPSAIINAAYLGDIDLVKRILATKPDVDVRDALGGTALHVAIFRNNLEVMLLLIDHGFDINAAASSNGFTPLHYCVWTNNAAAARLLVSRNADKNARDNEGLTPLEKATKDRKREMLLVLSRR